ncbi:endonuclease domain-containing protein [Hyphomonas sp. NPDC076900]|uniref:endonuclease domain-containing protein n=1 Tax=unclassified Hyphomonas TaxID=2630699 RepID=UPI003D02E122
MTDDPAIRRARRLRKSSNAPEDFAWQTLRTLRDHGFPVRRQHPINGVIADFAITRARLVIEIDGGVHARPEVQERDEERDKMLESLGWTILRIPAGDALHPDHLMRLVQEKLGL